MLRDRTNPVGYKLSVIQFENGEPVAAPDNNTAAVDVLANPDNSACQQGCCSKASCLRPVGIAFDSIGRLFMSSDDTGEIYVVIKDQTSPSSTTTGSSSTATSSSKSDAEKPLHYSLSVMLLTLLLCYFML